MIGRWALIAIFATQGVCAVFFVSEILMTVFGLRATPINWQTRELLELGAAVGLILGTVSGVVALQASRRRQKRAEERLEMASQAFMDMVEMRFAEWRLTPAERDVALFALKGCSLQEIADLRQTSEGTVKAQTAAIYRKAGVSGRTQLLSLFIDDLVMVDQPSAAPRS